MMVPSRQPTLLPNRIEPAPSRPDRGVELSVTGISGAAMDNLPFEGKIITDRKMRDGDRVRRFADDRHAGAGDRMITLMDLDVCKGAMSDLGWKRSSKNVERPAFAIDHMRKEMRGW